MDDFTNNQGRTAFLADPDTGIDARILRTMTIVTLLSVGASPFFGPWRVTAGLLLGGALSLLSHHWMKSSIAAAFSMATPGAIPRIGVVKFALRYFVVALVVFAAYNLEVISLPATLVGLCSFVAALFFEAFRELYFKVIFSRGT